MTETTVSSVVNAIQSKHMFPYIHRVIAIMQIISLLLLWATGFFITPFFFTSYFTIGPPFVFMQIEIDNWMLFVVYCVYLIGDQLVVRFSQESYHDVQIDKHNIGSLAIGLNGVWHSWISLTVRYMFIFSQMSFVLVLGITEVCFTLYAIDRRLDSANTKAPFAKYATSMIFMKNIQTWAAFAVIASTGVLQTRFFSAGPPLDVFQTTVSDNNSYIIMVIIMFVEHVFNSYNDTAIQWWERNHLLSTSNAVKQDTVDGVEPFGRKAVFFIVTAHTVFKWTRKLFVISFLFSQFLFTIVYAFGECVASFISWSQFKSSYRKIPMLLGVQWLFLLFVASIFFIKSPWNLAFFTWPPPLTVFGETFLHTSQVSWLLFYVWFERCCFTLFEKVTDVDMNDAIRTNNIKATGYSRTSVTAFLVLGHIHQWIRQFTLLHFALSNVSFIVMCALSDLIILLLVTHYVDKFNSTVKKVIAYINERKKQQKQKI